MEPFDTLIIGVYVLIDLKFKVAPLPIVLAPRTKAQVITSVRRKTSVFFVYSMTSTTSPTPRSLQLPYIPVTAFSQTDLFNNSDDKHGMMLTCRHVHVRPLCVILTEEFSCRLELADFAKKYLKIDWSVKIPLH